MITGHKILLSNLNRKYNYRKKKKAHHIHSEAENRFLK